MALVPAEQSVSVSARVAGRYARRVAPERFARWLVAATFIGLSIAWIIWSVGGLNFSDAEAYRQASNRFLAGEDLYVSIRTQDEAFRYAPWFAVAWLPFAVLPPAVGNLLWGILLVIASVAATAPIARQPGLPARLLAVFGGAMLLWTSARGNVHPLLMVALIHGIDRRAGPFWIALSASLKAVPIVFVLVYVARREWFRALITVAITAVLVIPMPLFGWEPSTTNPGESLSLWYLVSPWIFSVSAAVVMTVAVLSTWLWPMWAPLAAAVGAVMALPRLLLYDLTYLMVPASTWVRRE